MCDACSTADDLRLVHAAREAADAILERYLRVRLRKAFDLRSARGFDQAVGRLAAPPRPQEPSP